MITYTYAQAILIGTFWTIAALIVGYVIGIAQDKPL